MGDADRRARPTSARSATSTSPATGPARWPTSSRTAARPHLRLPLHRRPLLGARAHRRHPGGPSSQPVVGATDNGRLIDLVRQRRRGARRGAARGGRLSGPAGARVRHGALGRPVHQRHRIHHLHVPGRRARGSPGPQRQHLHPAARAARRRAGARGRSRDRALEGRHLRRRRRRRDLGRGEPRLRPQDVQHRHLPRPPGPHADRLRGAGGHDLRPPRHRRRGRLQLRLGRLPPVLRRRRQPRSSPAASAAPSSTIRSRWTPATSPSTSRASTSTAAASASPRWPGWARASRWRPCSSTTCSPRPCVSRCHSTVGPSAVPAIGREQRRARRVGRGRRRAVAVRARAPVRGRRLAPGGEPLAARAGPGVGGRLRRGDGPRERRRADVAAGRARGLPARRRLFRSRAAGLPRLHHDALLPSRRAAFELAGRVRSVGRGALPGDRRRNGSGGDRGRAFQLPAAPDRPDPPLAGAGDRCARPAEALADPAAARRRPAPAPVDPLRAQGRVVTVSVRGRDVDRSGHRASGVSSVVRLLGRPDDGRPRHFAGPRAPSLPARGQLPAGDHARATRRATWPSRRTVRIG